MAHCNRFSLCKYGQQNKQKQEVEKIVSEKSKKRGEIESE